MLLNIAFRKRPGGVAIRRFAIDRGIALGGDEAGFGADECLGLLLLLFRGRATNKCKRTKRTKCKGSDLFHE